MIRYLHSHTCMVVNLACICYAIYVIGGGGSFDVGGLEWINVCPMKKWRSTFLFVYFVFFELKKNLSNCNNYHKYLRSCFVLYCIVDILFCLLFYICMADFFLLSLCYFHSISFVQLHLNEIVAFEPNLTEKRIFITIIIIIIITTTAIASCYACSINSISMIHEPSVSEINIVWLLH